MNCTHCNEILDPDKVFIYKDLAICVDCGENLLIALWEWDQNTDGYITECLSK